MIKRTIRIPVAIVRLIEERDKIREQKRIAFDTSDESTSDIEDRYKPQLDAIDVKLGQFLYCQAYQQGWVE